MKSQYLFGVILVVASTTVFSLAGVFAKGVQADAWGVIFWRGLSATGFSLCYLLVIGKMWDELSRFGWMAMLASVIGAIATAAFLNAFKLTSVANVALIWATAPFVTAMMAWVAIREVPSRRVVYASAISVLGVFVVLGGSVGGGNIVGDALAGVMVLFMSAVMVIFRVYPKTPTSLTAAMSSVLLLPFGWFLTNPDMNGSWDIAILMCFGLAFAFASVTLFEGVRRIPASESALISTIETPLAPIWAFLILAETPPGSTILGGSIIMAAVVWSQFNNRRPNAVRAKASASGSKAL